MIIWTNYCTTNHIGKILHLDGDRRYTDKSSLYYKKAGLQAIVKYIPEYRQPSVIKNLLKKYNEFPTAMQGLGYFSNNRS